MTRVRTGLLVWSLCLVGMIVAVLVTIIPTQAPDPFTAREGATDGPANVPSLVEPSVEAPAVEPAPIDLRIRRLGISAPIRPVGMQDATAMEVPEDIGVVGWFRYSATPTSDHGTTVLVGHRDGSEDPNGVFRNLSRIKTGDRIIVTDEHETQWRYEVSDNVMVDAAEFAAAAEQIFDIQGAARLILITCGGEFIRNDGGYQSNIVITAVPVSD